MADRRMQLTRASFRSRFGEEKVVMSTSNTSSSVQLGGATIKLLLMTACCLVVAGVPPATAQIRGQYESGLNATNSGVFAPPGVTFASVFQLYSFDQAKDSSGTPHPISGNLSVLFQHNFVNWTTESAKAGAMRYGFVIDIPISSNSLTIAELGSLSSGAGLTDIYIQPLALGWNFARADIQAAYGFIAPTGRYKSGATDNAGSGYWGHDISSGQTVYLTKNKATSLSARSEEHTSELQSLRHLVCRLLLEKKKKKKNSIDRIQWAYYTNNTTHIDK